jgi:hemerythrin
MAIIIWSNDFSVRVNEIDQQHQKLVLLINRLHEAMSHGNGSKVIFEILDEMTQYAVYHFNTEEKYFEKYNFKGAESHIQSHADFVKKVSTFVKSFKEGKVTLTLEVMQFLSDWLQDHILGEDMEYSDCFVENGLS